jgi:isoamylase
VPMIFAGDDLSHTKNGNNNTYCHNNELTWLNWDLDERKQSFLEFVRTCARIWKEQPALQRRKFFHGRPIRGSGIKDISYFEPSGNEMSDAAWDSGWVQCLGVRLAGDMMTEVDERGEQIKGDTLLLLLNAHWQEIPFTLPDTAGGDVWQTLVDTAEPDRPLPVRVRPAREQFPLYGRSLALLRTVRPEQAGQDLTSTQAENIRKEARRGAAASQNPPLSK